MGPLRRSSAPSGLTRFPTEHAHAAFRAVADPASYRRERDAIMPSVVARACEDARLPVSRAVSFGAPTGQSRDNRHELRTAGSLRSLLRP